MPKITTPATPEDGPKYVRPEASAYTDTVPDLGGTSRGQELAPTGQPAKPFYLAVHPNRWVVAAGQIIPFARRINLSSGVGGVDVDAKGKPKPSLALAEAEEQGWTVLPWDVDGGTYLRQVTATGGWITRWEVLHPGTEEITTDQKGYAEFFARLIKAGKIGGPAPWVLDRLASELRAMAEAETKRFPQVSTERGKEIARQLEAVEKARKTRVLPPPAAAVEATPDVG